MEILKQLDRYKNSPFPILSVYLGTPDKKSPTSSVLYTLFHSLIDKNLIEENQKLFRNDIERINTYIKDSLDTRGNRSFIFFTSGQHLWEVLEFEFYLSPHVIVDNAPDIEPIAKAVEEHKKYLVLLVDREKGRIFTVRLGRIEEHRDVFEGEVPQRVKAKKVDYGRDDKIFRHIEDHLHRHLSFIAGAVNDFVRKDGINFIILGGHEEITPKMRKHLAKPLQKMVLGDFISELNIPLNDILIESKKIAAQVSKSNV